MGYSSVKCCICGSRGRLFNFPSGRSKVLFLKEWLKFCKLDEATYLRKKLFLCGKHFSECCFQNHLRNRLLSVAIPSLYPPGGEGIPTEDGTPGEFKAETFRKIVHELINKQNSIEPFQQKSKYNSEAEKQKVLNKSEEKENCLRTSSQDNSESRHLLVTSEPKLPNSPLFCQTKDLSCLKHPKSTTKQPTVNNSETKNVNSPNHSILPLIFKRVPIKNIVELSKIKSNRSLLKINSPTVANTSSFKSNEALKLNALNNDLSNSAPNSCPNSSICLNLKPASINVKTLTLLTKSNSKSGNFPPSTNSTSTFLAAKNSESSISGTALVDQLKSSSLEDSSIQAIVTPSDSVPSAMNSNSSMNSYENDMSDILSAAVNNSDITFSEDHFGAEEVVSSKKQQSYSMKSDKHLTPRMKYYDPVLIDSVLSKMKLKKNGPVRVVTLEKQPDRIFKGFTKNKVVTLYNQKLKKKKNKSTDKTVKIRKKRKCTCSIHCQNSLNSSKNSPPIINVSSGVGVKFEGTAMNPNMMNIDPDLADEELFNLENVFNVSTILTNVNDKFQIEQLCQMLIESIFRLKNLNIERTMTKLQVYISQMPSNAGSVVSTNKETSSICQVDNNLSKSNNTTAEKSVLNIETESRENLFSSISTTMNMNSNDPISSDAVSTNTDMEIPSSSEMSCQLINSEINLNKRLPKSKNVTVKLNTFHDHSYINKETNYIFEKPEYLVKLLDIGTYRRSPKKKLKPQQPAASKKEVEKQKKSYQKLCNKIIRLKELIIKKNMSIKSMNGKIKYLGSIVCEEKGIKRVKYPKEKKNIEDKEVLINFNNKPIGSEELIDKKRKGRPRKRKNPTEQINIDGVMTTEGFVEASSFNEAPECKIKKVSTNAESLDVLYETLIEEMCFSDTEY